MFRKNLLLTKIKLNSSANKKCIKILNNVDRWFNKSLFSIIISCKLFLYSSNIRSFFLKFKLTFFVETTPKAIDHIYRHSKYPNTIYLFLLALGKNVSDFHQGFSVTHICPQLSKLEVEEGSTGHLPPTRQVDRHWIAAFY